MDRTNIDIAKCCITIKTNNGKYLKDNEYEVQQVEPDKYVVFDIFNKELPHLEFNEKDFNKHFELVYTSLEPELSNEK